MHRPAPSFVAPAAVLAVATVVTGLVPSLVDPLVVAATHALVPGEPDVGHLALWHGLTPALGLSALTFAAGGVLLAARRPVERAQAAVHAALRPPRASGAYEATVSGLAQVAERVTGVVQSRSLPLYIAVVLAVAVALPVTALLRLDVTPVPTAIAESPLQATVAVAIAVAAAGATRARRRFSAVLLLGAVGYGVTLLFVLQGAPDLALTQLLIETLTVVVFVLVLRQMPKRFPTRPVPAGQAVRVVRRRVPRRHRHRVRTRRTRRADRAGGRGGLPGAVAAGGARPQRRQRDPRGLPRPGHVRGDHGAVRRRRRCRRARPRGTGGAGRGRRGRGRRP